MRFQEILSRFPGARRRGDQWQAKCPAHDDKQASLSLSEGRNGTTILKCFAGCAAKQIVAAQNLTLADLFEQPHQTTPKLSFRERIETAYDYCDESGQLLFQAVRLHSPKDFRQRKPDGNGGWTWKLGDVRRVLYRLPELLAADPAATIFVCEGEKDVERLRSLGLVATCNPMGAGAKSNSYNWRDDYNEPLRGRRIVVLPDNDEPGRNHAEAVAQSLTGIALSVKVLALPDLPNKGDVSNWLDAGGAAEELNRLAEDAAEWESSAARNTVQPTPIVRTVCMANVKREKVDWLWANRISLRALTIIEGIEGVGKSTLLCAIATAITHGRGLPDAEPTKPGNVVWFSAEDDLASVLGPRLDAAGADCSRIFADGEPFRLDEEGLQRLRSEIAEREPVLVIIDPVFAYTEGDANRGKDARALTSELKKIADQFNCAIVLVRHVGKSKGLGDPRAAGLYSIEWRAAARSVLLVGCDPDFSQKRAITQTKSNLGPLSGSLGYVIESDPNSPSGARFYWSGVSDLTAEKILSSVGECEPAENNNARTDAEEFLRAVLAEGPRLATDVEEEAKKAKLSFATLRRAKDSLGVRSRARGFGSGKKWCWELPEGAGPDALLDAHIDAKVLIYSEDEHLRGNRSDKSTYVNGLAIDAHPPMNMSIYGEGEHLSEHLWEREEGEI